MPHPITIHLHGDEKGYRPVDFGFYGSEAGIEMIEGVFKDEGPLHRPEVAFTIIIPVGFEDWTALNLEVLTELEKAQRTVVIAMST
jgi:hypothetical protein